MPDNPIPVFGFAAAVPTDTNSFYAQDTVLLNASPGNGQPLGWICTVEGRPGTWIQLGVTGSLKQAAAGGAAIGLGTSLVVNSAGGNLTLAAAQSHAPGHVLRVTNTAGASTLVAGSGNAIIGAATATSTTAFATLLSDGTTNWYRMV